MKTYTVIVSLLLCIYAGKGSAGCPDKWIRTDGICVLIDVTAASSRDAAYRYCERKGAHLTDPVSSAQNQKIKNILMKHRCRPVWLNGGRAKDGKFHFRKDNNGASFTGWARGQPKTYMTNKGYKDNCVQMSCSGWNAKPCSARYGVMCAKQDDTPTSTTAAITTSTSTSSTPTTNPVYNQSASTLNYNSTNQIVTSTLAPSPQNVTNAESGGHRSYLVTSTIFASVLVGLFKNY